MRAPPRPARCSHRPSRPRPGGSAQGGETLPLEEVSFNYAKIEWNYIQLDHNTGAVAGNFAKWWDLKTNTGG